MKLGVGEIQGIPATVLYIVFLLPVSWLNTLILKQRYTNPERQVSRANEFCTRTLHVVCIHSVTLLAPRIIRWPLDLCKSCVPHIKI